MIFPETIPLSEGSPVTWHHFLGEAAKGTFRAIEIFTQAEYGLVAHQTGKRHHLESAMNIYLHELNGLLLSQPPFPSFEACWRVVEQAGYLPQPLAPSSTPYHPYRFYDDLFIRGVGVAGAELLHDALQHCYRGWTLRAYYDLRERLGVLTEENLYTVHYNSQDLVAAMLYLLTVWAAHNQSD